MKLYHLELPIRRGDRAILCTGIQNAVASHLKLDPEVSLFKNLYLHYV